MLLGFNRRQGKRITDDYLRKRGHMLVAMLAVGINHTDILHHSVIINDTVGGATKGRCHAAHECVFCDLLLFQPLPSAAVQDVDVGHAQRDASALERLNELSPDHVCEPVNQNFAAFPFLSAKQKFLYVEG